MNFHKFQKFSNYFLIIAFCISLIHILYILSDGDMDIKKSYFFSQVFHNMWQHLKAFDLTIDRAIIRDEAFVIDGKYYAYFLPLPAIARGFLSLFRMGNAPILSVILASALFISSSYLILKQAIAAFSAKSGITDYYFFCAKIFLIVCSPIIVMLAYPMTYWEAIIWAIGCFMLCMYLSIAVLQDASVGYKIILFGLVCGTSIFTRPTEMLAISLLYASTLALYCKKHSSYFNFRVLISVSIVCLSFSLLGWMNFAKWGNPFEFGPLKYYTLMWSPEQYATFKKFGVFQLDRVPEALTYYFFPHVSNLSTDFPFIQLGSSEYFKGFAKHFDYRESSLPLSISMPGYLLLAGIGLFALIKTIFQDRIEKKENNFFGNWVAFTPSALACCIPGLVMLPWFALSVRYAGEFLPAITFYSVIGIVYIGNIIVSHRTKSPVVPEDLFTIINHKLVVLIAISFIATTFYLLSASAWIQHRGWEKRWAYLTPPSEINIDQKILFSKGSSGVNYLEGVGSSNVMGWGWSYPEETGIWSDGEQASVLIPIDRRSAVEILIHLHAFYAEPNKCFSFEIWLDGKKERRECIFPGKSSIIKMILPRPDVSMPKTQYEALITFKFDRNYSPKALKINDDARNLGVFLQAMEFSSARK